jgi:hypothetical protein
MAFKLPDGLQWPPELAVFDPDQWDSEFDWRCARMDWLKENGIRASKLSKIRAMTNDWMRP